MPDIQPHFSGHFFLRVKKFDAIPIGKAYGCPIVYGEIPVGHYGVHCAPEHDELVKNAITNTPGAVLEAYATDEQLGGGVEKLERWAGAQYVGSCEDTLLDTFGKRGRQG